MKLYIYSNEFQKDSATVQNAIVEAMIDLNSRIQVYRAQGISFNRIFNDDKIKYDKHGEFFTYKCHKSSLQLRILYAYVEINGESVLIVIDYIKKKKNNKRYIKHFEQYQSYSIEEILKNSIIYSATGNKK